VAITRFLFPENLPLIESLRKRHAEELDFRVEAAHLKEVSANLTRCGTHHSPPRLVSNFSPPRVWYRRGFEPKYVRVPGVPDERLVTRHVLAMELLPGISLGKAIEREQDDLAAALGIAGGGAALRRQLMRRVRKHFETGVEGEEEGGLSGGAGVLGAERLMAAASAVAPVARAVAAARRRTVVTISWLRSGLGFGLRYGLCFLVTALSLGLVSLPPPPPFSFESSGAGRVDVSRALRTLVRVHGVQMLLDGVYNCDPHPGNVLLLPDGRLGLIDYGMVGRLTEGERGSLARVVVGLARGDVEGVAKECVAPPPPPPSFFII